MFDAQTTNQFRALTGLGLQKAREILEDQTISVYIVPGIFAYEGQAWATLGEAQNNVAREYWPQIRRFAYTWKHEGRPCTCGSGAEWQECSEQSQYCG